MIIDNCKYEFVTLDAKDIAKDVEGCHLCDLSPLRCDSYIFQDCLEVDLQAIKDNKKVIVFLKKVK